MPAETRRNERTDKNQSAKQSLETTCRRLFRAIRHEISDINQRFQGYRAERFVAVTTWSSDLPLAINNATIKQRISANTYRVTSLYRYPRLTCLTTMCLCQPGGGFVEGWSPSFLSGRFHSFSFRFAISHIVFLLVLSVSIIGGSRPVFRVLLGITVSRRLISMWWS